MSHELCYEAHMCGQRSSNFDRTIEENEEYMRKVESEILALICMDPSKVRRSVGGGCRDEEEDCGWMNNAQYLTHVWEDLKEQWVEALSNIIRCSDAKAAMVEGTKEIELCPNCMVELEWRHLPPKDGGVVWRYANICPKCGTEYDDEGGVDGNKPTKATVKTFSEDLD